MRKKLLREKTNEKVLMNSSIQKALSRAPLSLDDLTVLESVDVASLIVEHNLSYPEAERVVSWVRNEVYRFNAQDVSFGGPGDEDLDPDQARDVRGTKSGTVYPGLRETKKLTRGLLRKIILNEIV